MATKTRLERHLNHLLSKQAAFGESKNLCKQAARQAYIAEHGNLKGYNPSFIEGKIFSIGSMKTYRAAVHDFCKWAQDNGIKSIKQIDEDACKRYLLQRQHEGKSAWTLSRDMSCLNRLFAYNLNKRDIGLKSRRMGHIIRSRKPVIADNRDYSKYANQMYVAEGTGMRRQSVTRITPNDFIRDSTGLCVAVRLHEKGGRDRISTIVGGCNGLADYRERVTEIINEAESRPNGSNMPIFAEYDKNIDNHHLRSNYCNLMLAQMEHERANNLPLCGGVDVPYKLSARDDKPTQYKGHGRDICARLSSLLGHNRIEILQFYIR